MVQSIASDAAGQGTGWCRPYCGKLPWEAADAYRGAPWSSRVAASGRCHRQPSPDPLRVGKGGVVLRAVVGCSNFMTGAEISGSGVGRKPPQEDRS